MTTKIKTTSNSTKLDLKFINTSLEEVALKQHNFWLGVSISLKPYEDYIAQECLKFIAKYSKKNALILIADDLNSINYQIIDKYNEKKATKKARTIGDEISRFYQNNISQLSSLEQSKIQIIKWRDIQNESLENDIEILKNEYQTNIEFKQIVNNISTYYLQSRKRPITSKRLEALSIYILTELPVLIKGIKYNNINYQAMLYPTKTTGGLNETVKKIMNEQSFADLRKKLNINKTNLLIDANITKTNK